MRYIVITVLIVLTTACHWGDKNVMEARKMALVWHNREIILPSVQAKIMGRDTLCPSLLEKKYKIFTYVDTSSCTVCNLGLLDWKQIMKEADSLSMDVSFLFFTHIKDYQELEEELKNNNFNYPIFYDYKGECNKLNHLPNHVFYQTFLLDENNKILLLGKPKPNNKIWKLYKKNIIPQKRN